MDTNEEERTHNSFINLEIAIRSGDLEKVRRLLSTLGVCPLKSWTSGYSVLHSVLIRRQLEMAKLLIKNSCPVFRPNGHSSLLHVAIVTGDLEIVQMLIQKGISLEFTDHTGIIPLYMMIYRFIVDEECIQILDCLVKHGVNINFKMRGSGFTLLHYAAGVGNCNIVRLLIDKKCHLNARSKQGLTALHIAALNKHSQIVALLLSNGAKYNIREENEKSPLCLAVENRDMATIEIFLNRALQSHRTMCLRDDKQLVCCAAGTGMINIVTLLVFKGAQINVHSHSSGKTDLQIAVETGSVDVVNLLLDMGANPNLCQRRVPFDAQNVNSLGRTALHSAVEKENQVILNLLLQRGANPSLIDENGMNPLHLATKVGSLPMITSLLNANSLLNNYNPMLMFTPDIQGLTPMHIAVCDNNEFVVRLFLSSGVPAGIRTLYGMTSLHIACARRYKNLVLLLLFYGADVNAAGRSILETPLYTNAYTGDLEILEILAQASPTRSSKWIEGFIPLYIAAYQGHEAMVNSFLDKGVDPNDNQGKYLTPLHAAAQKGNIGMVELLLQRGAHVDPTPETNSGFSPTPLLTSVRQGHERVTALLLYNKANPNVKLGSASERPIMNTQNLVMYGDYKYDDVMVGGSQVGYTPLLYAVKRQNETIVQMLLNHGANPNVKSEKEETPLGLAVERENLSIIQFLLAAGAHIDQHHTGQSVLQIASMKKNSMIFRILSKHGASAAPEVENTISLIGIAVERELITVVQNLVESGVDPNTLYNNLPILHIAVIKKNLAIVKLLLKYGADPKVSQNKITALGIAVENDLEDIVQCLLEAGADANIQENNKPLFMVAVEKRNTNVITKLLNYGVNVNISVEDVTPLGIAVFHELETITKILLEFGAEVNLEQCNPPILHTAVMKKNSAIVKLLLKHGVNVNERSKVNRTPLGIAIEIQAETIVKDLLEAGADIKILQIDRPVLEIAILNKNSKILQMLLYYKTDVDYIQNNFYAQTYTPLVLAVRESSAEIVELLLQRGPIANSYTDLGFSIHEAVRLGDEEKTLLLVKYGASIESSNQRGLTPLFEAVEKGHIKVVHSLLMMGANVNMKTSEGKSLLHFALERCEKIDILKVLVEYGADVNSRNENDLSPFFSLLSNVAFSDLADSDTIHEVTKLLLKNGAEVNIRDAKREETILHVAIRLGKTRIIETLLVYSADINIKNKNGTTAYKLAIYEAASRMYKMQNPDTFYFQNENVNELKDSDLNDFGSGNSDNENFELDDNDPEPYRKIANLMTKELARLHAAGAEIDEQNLNVAKYPFVKNYFNRCKEEIEAMKSKWINENRTFFDILIANESKVFQKLEDLQEFPIYATYLEDRIEKGKERQILMKSSSEALKKALRFEFPEHIVRHIFSFLTLRSLRNLCKACDPKSFITFH